MTLGSSDETNDESRQKCFMGALALIPTFSGDKKSVPIREFISAVTCAGRLAGCTPEQLVAVARLKMTGAACIFLDLNSKYADATWPVLQAALIREYEGDVSPQEVMIELYKCCQGNETVREYVNRLLQISGKLKIAEGTAEEREFRSKDLTVNLIHQFKRGLRKDIGNFVATVKYDNFDVCIDQALEAEKFIDQLN